MADDKKYYWLKLKRDFFKRHDIQIIEDMPNGKDYILFYLKLLCESVDHEGNLRFSEEIPYNEAMLASLTHTNVDIVRSAVKLFSELRMIDILDDGTYYMNQVEKMIGSETYWAQKKREQRENRLEYKPAEIAEIGQCPSVSNESPKCPSKRIEKEKDKELYIKKKSKKETTHTLFDSLLPNYNLSESLKQKLGEWLTYKAERNEQYKEQGLKSLLRQVENNQLAYGEQAVCALIDESMANMWKGIIFDRLKKSEKKQSVRKEIVPKWCNANADEAMEKAIQRAYKTAAEDEDLRERMETLKKQLGQ